jgi:hypothetical protein
MIAAASARTVMTAQPTWILPDPGFVEGTDQVVITLDDGTQKTVKRSEVQEKR